MNHCMAGWSVFRNKPLSGDIVNHCMAGWSVFIIKCYKVLYNYKVCFVVGSPHRKQFGACDSGFSFMGSGGEPAKMVIGDLSKKLEERSKKKK